VMLRLMSGTVFGLGVDAIEDDGELVIKPVAPRIIGTGLYVGVAQLDGGQAALVLDVVGVARAGGINTEIQRARFEADAALPERARPVQTATAITFAGFDGRCKAVLTTAVERLIEVPVEAVALGAGMPQLVFEGSLLPLFGLEADLGERAKLSVLLLGDGERRVGYAMAGEVDTAQLDTGSVASSGMATVALVDGQPVELIDCHALLAEASGGPREATCRLPLSDRWCRDFLRPLVEARGYQVVEDPAAEVDLAIVVEDSDQPDERAAKAGAVLRISKQRRGAGGSIYRYDREALVAALDGAQAGEAA